jgi:hypothetical protein
LHPEVQTHIALQTAQIAHLSQTALFEAKINRPGNGRVAPQGQTTEA